MRVLVACEFSGTVREAFRRAGHYAMSADFLPSEVQGLHYQGDVLDILHHDWDMLIAHPPCTDLAVSGARWFGKKMKDGRVDEALDFVRLLLNSGISRICVENPVSLISTYIEPPTQVIHPWQFGHGERKTTCLWLRGLPPLEPTNIVEGRLERVHRMAPGPDRWRERSRTFKGIAEAMAKQWG